MKVLIIDNYDSFVYNLVQYSGTITTDVHVRRNDTTDLEEVHRIHPDRIIISPGPGNPSNPESFGVCTAILQTISKEIPTLGVCLGHQGIVHGFGGKILRTKKVRHGKTSPIRHDGKGIFRRIENPFDATRYHSLVADRRTLPECLQVTAESLDDHEIMGVRHRDYPIEGVQFHPESILTAPGMRLIQNFLAE